MSQVFKDSINNDSINVFCLDIALHCNRTMQYPGYIKIFTHQADLSAHIPRDMADYYVTQAERLCTDGVLKKALHFYDWSKKLFLQYEKMNGPDKKYIDNIDRITEEMLRNNDDDDEIGCSSWS